MLALDVTQIFIWLLNPKSHEHILRQGGPLTLSMTGYVITF